MENKTLTHDQLQAECYLWFWNEYPGHRRTLIHVDNNSVNRIVGARKKALGVVRGPSDFILIAFGGIVCIELKVGRDVQSSEQEDFAKKVIERGGVYEIVSTFEQFKELIWSIIGK